MNVGLQHHQVLQVLHLLPEGGRGDVLDRWGEANFVELGDLKSVFGSLLSFMDLGGGVCAFFFSVAPSSVGRQPGY